MRHLKAKGRLGRDNAHRRALLANMAKSLIAHEKLATTLPKAKALRSYFDKLVTLGKQGDLHARRLAFQKVHHKEAIAKLFNDISPRFRSRQGGYTRIIKSGYRVGDCAPMAIITLTELGRGVTLTKKSTDDQPKSSSPTSSKTDNTPSVQ